MFQQEFSLPPFPRGYHLITREVLSRLPELPQTGVLHLFIKHTSAALAINENADPSVRTDFESVFNKLVPENMPFLTHTIEGPDDMPAHIKAALIGSSVTIPITGGRLNLGAWQGIYLCEFRNHGGGRKLVATVWGNND
jgi:secondary thiamine-phosphate synthase enzyme